VNSKTWVGDIQMGLVLSLDSVRIAYTHIYRTPEYAGQKSGDNFGAVSISATF
jgi:hypothetical protein